MKRLWWSLVCLLALGVASACDNGDNGEMDAGRDAGGGGEDSGPPPTPIVLATDGDDQVAPDFTSCQPRTAPAGSGDSTFTVTAEDFFDNNPVEGLQVQFFPDNTPSLDGTCTGTCQAVTTNASGQATVMGSAGAWYAYRVLAGEGINTGTPADYIGVVQVNEETPEDGGDATLNVVKNMTRNLILSLLGVSAEDDTAVVTGVASDCQGRDLANVTLRIFDSTGEIDLGFASTGPRAFYFDGNSTPSGRQRLTNTDGLYGAANVPLPADNTLRVELWGTLTEGGSPEMLGCETVQVGADGITIINVGPTRTDGPSGCSG